MVWSPGKFMVHFVCGDYPLGSNQIKAPISQKTNGFQAFLGLKTVKNGVSTGLLGKLCKSRLVSEVCTL